MTTLRSRKAQDVQVQLAECPYPGPAPFTSSELHKANFFGRASEAAAIGSLLYAHQVVLVHAPSGAGKTSLLRAKVMPDLEAKGFTLIGVASVGPSAVMTSGLDWENERVVPNPYSAAALGSLLRDHQLKEIAATPLDAWLKSRPERVDKYGDPAPSLLVIDQFEEILEPFERDDWLAARADFVEQLGRALTADPELRVLVAFREDHLAEIERLMDDLPERYASFRLDRLDRDAARKAIERPAEGTGVTFAPGVVGELLDGLATRKIEGFEGPVPDDYVVPAHLQVVCRKLWLDAVVTESKRIEKVGRLEEALAEHYRRAVKGAARPWMRPLVRRFVRRRLITPRKTRKLFPITREKRTWLLPNVVLEDLERTYGLVRKERRGGTSYWELSHDGFVDPVLEVNSDINGNYTILGIVALVVLLVAVSWSAAQSEGRPQAGIAGMALPETFSTANDEGIEALWDKDLATSVTFDLDESGASAFDLTIQLDGRYAINEIRVEPGERRPREVFFEGELRVPVGAERIRRAGPYGPPVEKLQLRIVASELDPSVDISEVIVYGRPADG